MRGLVVYVVVVALDFSKAFDTVRHSSAMAKVAQLQLPDCVYNWLANFLDGHSHCTRFNGHTPGLLEVNASFVQATGFCDRSWHVRRQRRANAQRDGRPAEHRWRPLFNAAKFG